MTFDYPSSDDHWKVEYYTPLSITLIEDREEIDIGLLDHKGDPVKVSPRRNPIGFVHFD